MTIDPASVNQTLQAFQTEALENAQELKAEQMTSKAELANQLSESVNPFAAALKKQTKTIKSQKGRVQKNLGSSEKAQKLLPLTMLKQLAEQFQKRNPELQGDTLVGLRQSIKPDDSKEEILKKIFDAFPDVALADEALEYLILTSDGPLANKLSEIKEELNRDKGREIVSGRNIQIQAQEASTKGIGTPTTLRDMYRKITSEPKDAPALFDELSKQYSFKDLQKVMKFLFHALGADMNSKGPSIEPAELQRLFSETRNLQSIMGVYRFFQNRMKLIDSQFEQHSLEKPPELTFESLSKQFMALAAERYPSADKVLQKAVLLGVENMLVGKIITFSQFRDAVREVAMAKIYNTVERRNELFNAIIDALTDLEDEMDELDSGNPE